MNKTKLILLVGMSLSLFSCASMEKSWVSSNCNKEAAYAQGMNDSRDEKPMNVAGYSNLCGADKADIMASYRQGYEAGLPKEAAAAPAAGGTTNNGTIINVDLGKLNPFGHSDEEAGPATPPAENQKAWFCESEAFMHKYSSFGPTKLEAKQGCMQKCTAEYNEMHCKEVKCSKNI